MGSVFYTAFVERRAVRMKKKVATKHEFEAIIQRAMQQYNVSYHYCDYFKEYFDNDEYMLDLIHLNGLGADHFSRKFDELLKKEVYIH